jgi:hypothetical protein
MGLAQGSVLELSSPSERAEWLALVKQLLRGPGQLGYRPLLWIFEPPYDMPQAPR